MIHYAALGMVPQTNLRRGPPGQTFLVCFRVFFAVDKDVCSTNPAACLLTEYEG